MGLLGSIERTLRPAACFVMLPLGLIGYSTGALLHALLGGSPREVHFWYTGFSRFGTRLAATELEVHGLANLEPDQAYVVVSNHESNWDPFAILAGLPELLLRFVVKQQLMRVPIFGQALAWSGNIRVDRKHPGTDVERVRAGMSDRQPEVSILFFAEGTRARDGAFREFRKGAFATALSEKLPILPIAVAGTYAIWPPGTAIISRGVAVVEVGPPIPVDGLGMDARDALRDQAHETVAKLRVRARQRIRDRGGDPGGSD